MGVRKPVQMIFHLKDGLGVNFIGELTQEGALMSLTVTIALYTHIATLLRTVIDVTHFFTRRISNTN